jgi:hypothetical protein
MDLDGPLKSVWERGHVSVGDLWSFYRRYPYLSRLRDRSVLDQAVRSVLDEITWEMEGFALAQSFEESTGTYRGLTVPYEGSFGPISDTTLLVLPAVANQQRQAEREATATATQQAVPSAVGEKPAVDGAPAGGREAARGGAPAGRTTGAISTTPPPPSNVRFFGVAHVNPERYSRDLTRIAQEVLQHLAAVDGVDLEVTVEIRATTKDGFPDDKVRIVTENAKTLKFDQFGFENN